jgi:hypothetical protein
MSARAEAMSDRCRRVCAASWGQDEKRDLALSRHFVGRDLWGALRKIDLGHLLEQA